MSERPSNEHIVEEINNLSKRIDQLAMPYEDALANRLFDKVQSTFKTWLTVWLGVISLVIALIGYVGYEEILSAGKMKIEEQIATQVTTQLQDEIIIELDKARDQTKETLLQSSLDDVSKLDTDLAQLLSDTQEAIDLRIKEFAAKLSPVIDAKLPEDITEKPRVEKLSAFAYFGIRSDSGWSEKNFRVEDKPDSALPEPGDKVTALVPVNARAGVIELTLRGWVNKPIVGLIKKGDELKVIEVERVAGGSYVWFKFERIK